MDGKKNIIWLASYPKSGNTWFRAFLSALLDPEGKAADINKLYNTTIASSRSLFDELTGVAASDLTTEETNRFRPYVYRQEAQESNERIYHKIHDAYTLLPDGTPLIPADVTRAVLYFIRNPLDVAVSFSHHLSTNIDKTIRIMNNPEYAFCSKNDRLPNQLRQRLLTWSGHVTSWVDESRLPVLVLRYEDMLSDPLHTFSQAVKFIELRYSRKQIKKALDNSSFDKLRKQEQVNGFHEKSAHASSFFRKGIAGDWKNALTSEQVRGIVDAHQQVMERFGYLEGL